MKNSKKTKKTQSVTSKKSKTSKKVPHKKNKKLPSKEGEVDFEKIVPVVIKSEIEWDDSYPLFKETCRINNKLVELPRYLSALNLENQAEFDKFLFEVVRSNNLPNFVRNNFKKIRKMIEKEIQYRLKAAEKLNREQGDAFKSFFKDSTYFDYSLHSEYFEHEMEKVFVNYLKVYCSTGMYESRVRIGNKKRREILEKIHSNG